MRGLGGRLGWAGVSITRCGWLNALPDSAKEPRENVYHEHDRENEEQPTHDARAQHSIIPGGQFREQGVVVMSRYRLMSAMPLELDHQPKRQPTTLIARQRGPDNRIMGRARVCRG
jgi:hypothetical protein